MRAMIADPQKKCIKTAKVFGIFIFTLSLISCSGDSQKIAERDREISELRTWISELMLERDDLNSRIQAFTKPLFQEGEDTPVSYKVCEVQPARVSPNSKYFNYKINITPLERDLSKISTTKLARTAYAALQYHEKWYSDAASFNVLLFESCSTNVALARAFVGDGKRICTATNKHQNGPRLEIVRVAEEFGKIKSPGELTTKTHYDAVAKKLKMTPDKVRDLTIELVEYSLGADYYSVVKGTTPELQPTTPRK